jgi:hypothetical protein
MSIIRIEMFEGSTVEKKWELIKALNAEWSVLSELVKHP